jgi:hypothetical protein
VPTGSYLLLLPGKVRSFRGLSSKCRCFDMSKMPSCSGSLTHHCSSCSFFFLIFSTICRTRSRLIGSYPSRGSSFFPNIGVGHALFLPVQIPFWSLFPDLPVLLFYRSCYFFLSVLLFGSKIWHGNPGNLETLCLLLLCAAANLCVFENLSNA